MMTKNAPRLISTTLSPTDITAIGKSGRNSQNGSVRIKPRNIGNGNNRGDKHKGNQDNKRRFLLPVSSIENAQIGAYTGYNYGRKQSLTIRSHHSKTSALQALDAIIKATADCGSIDKIAFLSLYAMS